MLYNQTLSVVLTVVLLYLSGQASGVWRQRCGKSQTGTRIIGGETAVNGKWPWMAHIEFCPDQGRCYNCGGSLISDQWILTAAHCVIDKKGAIINKITANFSNYDFTYDEWNVNTFQVKQPIVHWLYKNYTLDDIALLELSEPLDLNGMGIEPICLPPADLPRPVGTQCVATGWGDTIGNIISPSKTLQQVTLPIANADLCANRVLFNNSDTQLCVGTTNEGKDTCNGDSGGPLNCELANGAWVIEGVVSYGASTCGNEPSVFTRVSAYIPWIEYNTKPKILINFNRDI